MKRIGIALFAIALFLGLAAKVEARPVSNAGHGFANRVNVNVNNGGNVNVNVRQPGFGVFNRNVNVNVNNGFSGRYDFRVGGYRFGLPYFNPGLGVGGYATYGYGAGYTYGTYLQPQPTVVGVPAYSDPAPVPVQAPPPVYGLYQAPAYYAPAPVTYYTQYYAPAYYAGPYYGGGFRSGWGGYYGYGLGRSGGFRHH